MTSIDARQIIRSIDHTLLKPETTEDHVRQLCSEAIEFGFASVCVNPRWVEFASRQLEDHDVKVCSVAGFPLGAELTKVKSIQAKYAIMAGADEIDFVADIPSILENNHRYVNTEFATMVSVCHSVRPSVTLKVIIESALLNEEQIKFACYTAANCKVDFVKTSTGLHPAGGAKYEDVMLMKESAGNCKVKAAGGIRTPQQAIEMIEAGAERIGTSSGAAIARELLSGQGNESYR